MEVELYVAANRKVPFTEWLNSLKDIKARSKIRTRLDRVELGNLGDHKSVGDGVFELRVDFGPGYRIYFGRKGDKLIILLLGGDKGSQEKDIKKAKNYWQELLSHDQKKNHKIP